MSWLLFLDESGHDHRTMPYEVTGGVALHAEKLWPFVRAARALEQSIFGAYLHDFGSEIKGCRLLEKKRFKWASQGDRIDDQALRKHALNFLNSTVQGRTPRREEFTAFGQASLRFAEELLVLLRAHQAFVFAGIIPPVPRPTAVRSDVPRKDIVFLLERYSYFLKERDEMGLLILDQTEKASDRELVHRMQRYFAETQTGAARAQWVVPVPLFVESDMAYGVQVADLCIYCINWGHRLRKMDAPTRPDIATFVPLFDKCIWRGRESRAGEQFKTESVFFVPDPYSSRSEQK